MRKFHSRRYGAFQNHYAQRNILWTTLQNLRKEGTGTIVVTSKLKSGVIISGVLAGNSGSEKVASGQILEHTPEFAVKTFKPGLKGIALTEGIERSHVILSVEDCEFIVIGFQQ